MSALSPAPPAYNPRRHRVANTSTEDTHQSEALRVQSDNDANSPRIRALSLRSRLVSFLRPVVRRHPVLKELLLEVDTNAALFKHWVAQYFPSIIRPQIRNLTIAITAQCNLRCVGCRYGRDFMPGQQLSWPIVRNLLNDAKRLGVESIRFYGGEPLLHPELSLFVRHAVKLGLRSYVTTNGILLKDRICELYEAGLRDFTIGFYGTGAAYDDYVQRKNRFARLERSVASVRELYGMGVNLRLNWLLMRPTCSIEALHEAWSFADQYSIPIQVDLIHYSLPYFTEGPNRELQFRPEDRPQIEKVVAEIIRLKNERPQMLEHSLTGLRSIPDWLIKGPAMKVPCDKYEMIWVGADGTVQLCYVTFKLGNLHSQRLAQMVYGSAHQKAARDCYTLNCPNCHCGYDSRIQKHAASRWQYGLKHSQTGHNSQAQAEPSNACLPSALYPAENISVAISDLVVAAKK